MALTATTVPEHPAKFHPQVLDVIARYAWGDVLDPFAGTGLVHRLLDDGLAPAVTATTGLEIQPRWAAAHPRTIVGDVHRPPFPAAGFDCIVTSPCYGNRYADHHTPRDGSVRHSYTFDYGAPLEPNNAGLLQWGERYRAFHLRAWREALRVMRPGGRFVLNISDHKRGHEVRHVTDFHRWTLQALGLIVVKEKKVCTPRNRFGANRDARVDYEWVIVLDDLDHRAGIPGSDPAPS